MTNLDLALMNDKVMVIPTSPVQIFIKTVIRLQSVLVGSGSPIDLRGALGGNRGRRTCAPGLLKEDYIQVHLSQRRATSLHSTSTE